MNTKISCLTVTLDRPEHLKRAYACYRAQTYPDKELVIVTDGGEDYVGFIRNLTAGAGDVRLVVVPGRQPLGTLRNRSILASTGDTLCQWDDDDLSHPERLEVQLRRMQGEHAQASFFTSQLQLFWENRIAYWTDWKTKTNREAHQHDPRPHLIPGTLMCHLGVMPEYPPQATGEDTVVKNALCRSGVRIAEIGDRPWLSVYTYHGRNTYDRAHHDAIHRHLAIPVERFSNYQDLIKAVLAQYPCLDPPIALLGRDDQPAFVWTSNGSA